MRTNRDARSVVERETTPKETARPDHNKGKIEVSTELYDYLMETLFAQFSEEYYASGWYSGFSQSKRTQEAFTKFVKHGIESARHDYVTNDLPVIRKCVEDAIDAQGL